MKKWILGAALLAVALPMNAQELPQPSPTSTVDQRIGLTDFSITYSRPATRGRAIFGDLVPYNEVWRTGANACVILSASTDFTMNGNEVKAGEYALFTIPGENEWTIIYLPKPTFGEIQVTLKKAMCCALLYLPLQGISTKALLWASNH
jgi:hypothetical protein